MRPGVRMLLLPLLDPRCPEADKNSYKTAYRCFLPFAPALLLCFRPTPSSPRPPPFAVRAATSSPPGAPLFIRCNGSALQLPLGRSAIESHRDLNTTTPLGPPLFVALHELSGFDGIARTIFYLCIFIFIFCCLFIFKFTLRLRLLKKLKMSIT